MGSACRALVVDGPPAAAEHARELVTGFERRWSRFLPSSEISQLNSADGALTLVSTETYRLIELSVDAWRLTEGAFDPTVLPSLVRAGYDRSFDRVAERGGADDGHGPAEIVGSARPTPGCAGIELFPRINAVRLPRGVQLDPGGLGKGLAADLVVGRLLEAGVAGALVDLGGDIVCRGSAPHPAGWGIAVEDPLVVGRNLLSLTIGSGAVATSSRLLRRWQRGSEVKHHLIDPTTGDPLDTPLVAATAVAGEAWWAEALTKSIFVGGRSVLESLDEPAVAVDEAGQVLCSPALDRACVTDRSAT
jgi:FAD:protein FMN transferase